MKGFGFLQTYSPAHDIAAGEIADPLSNFILIFKGSKGGKYDLKVKGASKLDHDLWQIVCTLNEYGWRVVHFAILDHLSQKHDLDLSVIHHEKKIVHGKHAEMLLFETILGGKWGLYLPER